MRSRGTALVLVLIVATAWAVHTQDRQEEQGDRPARPATLILDRADTVEFTTDEGTWMSLDVSPDGTTIAFDLLGDLYTLPIAGGNATRIAGGMSFDSQPKFSPDGRLIAFLSDRSGVENLWIANADGSNPRAVTRDRSTQDRPQLMSSPSWTATGPGVFSSSGLDDKDAAAAFIKRYKEAYKTDTIKQYVAGDRIVRQWIILAARQYRLMPTTEGALDLKLDLSQMIDGYTGSEHSLPILGDLEPAVGRAVAA